MTNNLPLSENQPVSKPAEASTGWSLREQILRIGHNWPVPVIVFLIGSLIGWGLSFIFSSGYRAEAELLVAYDSFQQCRNPDDCKNWFIGQLSTFAVSSPVLAETLERLAAEDPYWNGVNESGLAAMLDLQWSNPGKWVLVAETPTAERSAAAVSTWSEVFVEQYLETREHTLNVLELNTYIRQLQENQADLVSDRLLTASAQSALENFRRSITDLDPAGPLDEMSYWRLNAIVAQGAGFDPAWLELLDSIPAADRPVGEYLSWIEQVLVSFAQRYESLTSQIEELQSEINTNTVQLEQEIAASYNLAATIEIQPLGDAQPTVTVIRPAATLAALGGLIALLAWALAGAAYLVWRSEI